MVYINFFKKNLIVKNIKVHLKVLVLLKNTSYNVFKMFLGIFHSLDQFQTFRVYIYQYIEITLCENNYT
jgi:hypothetical protein